MNSSIGELRPLRIRNARHAVEEIANHLRLLIVTGRLAPETKLSQVELARVLGVSRTPVREALRILQQLGFVQMEANCRAQVTGFAVADLVALYATRIAVESLVLQDSVPGLAPAVCAELSALAAGLAEPSAATVMDDWLDRHRRFHMALFAGVSAPLARTLAANIDRSDFFVAMYLSAAGPARWPARLQREHHAIAAACSRRDTGRVVTLVGEHLYLTARALVDRFAPGQPVTLLDHALRMARAAGLSPPA
ncbi:MAG: GntR family transcriptional regulator [Gammaproteobacteria bacterium]|nr:GntR family transcriptional regulator [Gammaproteobacteria bacterium]